MDIDTIDVTSMPKVRVVTMRSETVNGEIGPGMILSEVLYEDGIGVGVEIIGTGIKFGIGAKAALQIRDLLNSWVDIGSFPGDSFALAE